MFLTRTANLFCDAALALLYPQSCAVCGGSVESRADGVACARCWASTRLLTPDDTFCWKCGAPSAYGGSKVRKETVRCRRCDGESFTLARACGVYEGALRAAVLSLKREPHLAPRLAKSMLETQARQPLSFSTRIVPVPLHPNREKERGFNQAAVLARQLSSLTSIPCDETNLARPVHTERHRAGMDARARRESVENVFEVRYPLAIEGETVLLIDDVFTTGATVSACARVLRAAGAREVFVLTLARPS